MWAPGCLPGFPLVALEHFEKELAGVRFLQRLIVRAGNLGFFLVSADGFKPDGERVAAQPRRLNLFFQRTDPQRVNN